MINREYIPTKGDHITAIILGPFVVLNLVTLPLTMMTIGFIWFVPVYLLVEYIGMYSIIAFAIPIIGLATSGLMEEDNFPLEKRLALYPLYFKYGGIIAGAAVIFLCMVGMNEFINNM